MNIEEIAFKDRKTLVNLNAIDLLDIIEFLQNDRKQWINQFTQTHNESVDIQKENKELKEKLDEYENPEDMTLMMMWCTEQARDKIKELERQLEELEVNYKSEHNMRVYFGTQQNAFIKYLEDKKDRLARECSNIYEDSLGKTRFVNEDIFNEINDVFKKYKEIIGVSDEKEN